MKQNEFINNKHKPDFWDAPQQGSWDKCPRYNIQITGCSRHFVCKVEGLKACYAAFPKQTGTNIATLPKSMKLHGFSVKQHIFSVKMVGM